MRLSYRVERTKDVAALCTLALVPPTLGHNARVLAWLQAGGPTPRITFYARNIASHFTI